jgi:hypothetical protein
MTKNFLIKKNKRYNFTSKYNVKLYKKCLSLKLIFSEGNINQPNLIVDKKNTSPVRLLKCIYARSEKIPLRLLRFFFLLNYTNLMNMGIKFLVAKKLSVYNGNKAKLININSGPLEVTLRCSFKFGDLIFTRAKNKFKKKKKKK